MEKTSVDPYEVVFDGVDDQEDAVLLPNYRKWIVATTIALTLTCITCISLSWALASEDIQKHFGVGEVTCTLGILVYIWGLGTGGIFLSPISEYHGRKVVYTLGLTLVVVFEFLTAFCNNYGGVLFGRFMLGFFGLAFLSVAGGTYSDLFRQKEFNADGKRPPDKQLGYALIMYSVSPFIGPGIGPLVTGFVCMHLNFRWVFYIMLMWLAAICVLVILVVPETYEPVLLKRKAERIRKETGDNRYYTATEHKPLTLWESIIVASKRPVLLLCCDYMTFVLCFYTGFTLGIVYLFFVAFPYIFQTVYEFDLGLTGLSFLGLVVGMLLMLLATPKGTSMVYQRLLARNNGVHKTEFRLIPLFAGVFVVPMGLFILAWTSRKDVHWMGPIVGSAVFGCGTTLVFSGIFQYTVEAYRLFTASAMAANTFVRCVMAGVFPLFGLKMYRAMGIDWATTLLALFLIVLIPVPFLFYRYGEYLRSKSQYTWSE